jgi:ribosome biogenesis protein UTP30
VSTQLTIGLIVEIHKELIFRLVPLRQPIPVAIARKDLKAELERAIASTYMQVTTGTSLSIKIGTTSLHTPSELLANLLAVLPYIAARIPNAPASFSNVQSLHLKTSTSTSLPIYNSKLEERFTGYELTEEEQKAKDAKVAEKAAEKTRLKEEKEQRKKERSATKDGKGRLEKKRTADEDEDEEVEKAVEQEKEVPEAAPVEKGDGTAEKRPSKKVKKDKKEKKVKA